MEGMISSFFSFSFFFFFFTFYSLDRLAFSSRKVLPEIKRVFQTFVKVIGRADCVIAKLLPTLMYSDSPAGIHTHNANV
jgi:hypothetical protein